jgi:hypothetical protein
MTARAIPQVTTEFSMDSLSAVREPAYSAQPVSREDANSGTHADGITRRTIFQHVETHADLFIYLPNLINEKV